MSFFQLTSFILALEAMEDTKVYHTKITENDGKTKQTIFMLLNDLMKLQKVSSIHATPGL
jgi:hypothetical protein